jgi:hypothetical protein
MNALAQRCTILALCFSVGTTALGVDERPYDFRKSAAYGALSDGERDKLRQAAQDFASLWGALDMYADEHEGRTPNTLEDLVPRYLPQLPRDPFASHQSAGVNDLGGARPSLSGWGYRYRPGASGKRAWCISSVGLPEFPFLAREGNVGLYVCKGTWVSGRNI